MILGNALKVQFRNAVINSVLNLWRMM